MIAGAPSRMARDSTEAVLAAKSSSRRMAVPARAARQLEHGFRAKQDKSGGEWIAAEAE